MILDPQLEAEAYAPPPGPPPRMVPRQGPQKPALAVVLYGDCATCGAHQALRLDGTIRLHYRHADGPDGGRYVTNDRCPGSHQRPAEGLFRPDSAE